jgi:hypothetical protein
MEQGVNYFDTAVPYHSWKSEPFLGMVFSKNGCREKVKIATKLPHWSAGSKEDMDRILDEQLSKLKTDRIDYYLIHGLGGELWETAKHNGVIEFMDDALKKGKIINAGFSFHGLAEEFNIIVDDYDWTFCQIQYNYLDTQNQAGTAGLQYAASKDMAVIIMEPLRKEKGRKRVRSLILTFHFSLVLICQIKRSDPSFLFLHDNLIAKL